MIGTGYFDGICSVATDNAAGAVALFDFFDYDLSGAYRFTSGDWQRVHGLNLNSSLVDSFVLRAGGDAPLGVIRPSVRSRGIFGVVQCNAGEGAIVRLYSDLVSTPGATFAELKFGSSGYVKAVSSMGEQTNSLDVALFVNTFSIAVGQWPLLTGRWYLTAQLSGLIPVDHAAVVECSPPRWGRMAIGTEAESVDFSLVALQAIGFNVNAAGENDTHDFALCRSLAFALPPCYPCAADSFEITLAGFPPLVVECFNVEGHPLRSIDINGSYTVNREGASVAGACRWSGSQELDADCISVFGTPYSQAVTMDVAWAADGSALVTVNNHSVSLPPATVDDWCGRLHGLEIDAGDGATLSIG